MGGLDVANSVTYSFTSQFGAKAVAPCTVSGTKYGEYKAVGILSRLNVYQAGHEV